MNNRIIAASVAALTLGAVIACNQVDPGDDTDTNTTVHPPWVWQCEKPGDNAAADETDLYPLQDGGKWSFHRFGGLEHIGNDILVVDLDSWENLTMKEVSFGGGTAYQIEDSANVNGKVTQNWHVPDGNVVFRRHKEEFNLASPSDVTLSIDYYLGTALSGLAGIDEYVDGFKRFDFAWVAEAEGWSETVAYNRWVNVDSSGNNGEVGVEEVRVHRFTLASLDETVTVPAGTFEGCVRIERARLREATSNASEAERRADIKNYWYCPGIGKVKEQEVNDDPRTEELLYYCIPGGLCC